MKLKIDENLPAELADALRTAGHDAETVAAEHMAGYADQVVLRHARHEQRILITMDKGIANIRTYPPSKYAGIVLLRLKSTGRKAVLSFASKHLPALLSVELRGKLLVVSEAGVRTRQS